LAVEVVVKVAEALGTPASPNTAPRNTGVSLKSLVW
jgi:hypothetical protein